LKRDFASQQRRESQIAARLAELRELARRMTAGFIAAQRSFRKSDREMEVEMLRHLELYRRKRAGVAAREFALLWGEGRSLRTRIREMPGNTALSLPNFKPQLSKFKARLEINQWLDRNAPPCGYRTFPAL
jgi:hypothetical protein